MIKTLTCRRKGLAVFLIALAFPFLLGLQAANAGWIQYQYGPKDIYNSPGLNPTYDLTSVDFAISDEDPTRFDFFLTFPSAVKANTFADGHNSWAGVLLDLNNDGKADYSLETDFSIPYVSNQWHAGRFIDRTSGNPIVSTQCDVRTWTNLDTLPPPSWIGFSISKSCIPFGPTAGVQGIAVDGQNPNTDFDYAPDSIWTVTFQQSATPTPTPGPTFTPKSTSITKLADTCTKINQLQKISGRTYVCAKSGSKFVWKLVVAKPTQKATTQTKQNGNQNIAKAKTFASQASSDSNAADKIAHDTQSTVGLIINNASSAKGSAQSANNSLQLDQNDLAYAQSYYQAQLSFDARNPNFSTRAVNDATALQALAKAQRVVQLATGYAAQAQAAASSAADTANQADSLLLSLNQYKDEAQNAAGSSQNAATQGNLTDSQYWAAIASKNLAKVKNYGTSILNLEAQSNSLASQAAQASQAAGFAKYQN